MYLCKKPNIATINPHINFNGNAAAAIEFYRVAFGGGIFQSRIGKSNHLIGNDVPGFLGKVNEDENRSKISISAESKEEADRLFDGLSKGGTVEMPMADSPWGSYFGMFRDKFGIEWILEFEEGSAL